MKKKIFMITLAACLIILSIASTSLAYFTDTDAKSNVFTVGNVGITLNYTENDARLYPGQAYGSATITNVGNEEAYVGAIIKLTVPQGTSFETVSSIFTGLSDNTNNTNNTIKYVQTETVQTETVYTVYTVYVVVGTVLATGSTANIFTNMAIPATWGNAEMALLRGLSVDITAYATQTVGFNNATEALKAAFANNGWENYPNN